MDAILKDRDDLDYSDKPPVLLAASSDAAMARGRGTIEALGLRLGAAMAISDARERIAQQGAATAVWIELDQDCGARWTTCWRS